MACRHSRRNVAPVGSWRTGPGITYRRIFRISWRLWGTTAARSLSTMAASKSKRRRSSQVPVKVCGSGIHGQGVFATRHIPKGERIIEYTGARISWDEAQRLPPHDPNNPYHTTFFSLEDGDVINPAVGGNEAQWINHSCDPNCETTEENGHIFVVASRELKRGSELFFDYRLEPADRRTKKLEAFFKCHCGSAKCRGTMLEPV